MSTKELKPYLLLITYAGVVFLAVTHLDRILNQISWITSVIMPLPSHWSSPLCSTVPIS